MITLEQIPGASTGIIREEFSAAGHTVRQILLFGSRARREAVADSDWDFFVILQSEIAFPEKNRIITRIQRRLAEEKVSADIIVKSEAQQEKEKRNTGFITYYALRDGVAV
jgi:predicted nucleotidyltransferase